MSKRPRSVRGPYKAYLDEGSNLKLPKRSQYFYDEKKDHNSNPGPASSAGTKDGFTQSTNNDSGSEEQRVSPLNRQVSCLSSGSSDNDEGLREIMPPSPVALSIHTQIEGQDHGDERIRHLNECGQFGEPIPVCGRTSDSDSNSEEANATTHQPSAFVLFHDQEGHTQNVTYHSSDRDSDKSVSDSSRSSDVTPNPRLSSSAKFW